MKEVVTNILTAAAVLIAVAAPFIALLRLWRFESFEQSSGEKALNR